MERVFRTGAKQASPPVGAELVVPVEEEPELVSGGHPHASAGEHVGQFGEVHAGLAVFEEEPRQERFNPEPGDVDVEPGAIAAQRTAKLGASVEERLEAVGLSDPPGPERVVEVFGLEALVLVEEAAAAGELVGASPGDDVQEDARGLDLSAMPGSGDLHLLEAVEGVIGDAGAHRRRIGDVHAVQVVLVLCPRRTGGRKEGLLAALGAAHVDLGHHDSGGLFQHGPEVPRVGQVLEHGPVHRFPDSAAAKVEALAGDRRDAFGDSGEPKLQPHLDHRTGVHHHFGGWRVFETGVRRRDAPGAGLEPGEAESARWSGSLFAPDSASHQHEGHPRAGQNAAGAVEHEAVHPAGRLRPFDQGGGSEQYRKNARSETAAPGRRRGGEGGIRTLGAVSRATA